MSGGSWSPEGKGSTSCALVPGLSCTYYVFPMLLWGLSSAQSRAGTVGGGGQVLQKVVTVSEELPMAGWPVGKRGRLRGPRGHRHDRLRGSNGTERKHAPTRPQPWARRLGAGERARPLCFCLPPLTCCGLLGSLWPLRHLHPHPSMGPHAF